MNILGAMNIERRLYQMAANSGVTDTYGIMNILTVAVA